MPPRIIRPRSDRAHWIPAAALGVSALAVGYVGGARVFAPSHAAGVTDESEPVAETAVATADGIARDGGATSTAAAGAMATGDGSVALPVAIVDPAPEPPRIPVRVSRSVIQSCGDGEELNLLGARCEPVAGLDEALRHHLVQLGSCPAAEAAAASPEATLSIGLRVDFPRRRVTALPGRSSSVHNPLTFVPCARAAIERATDLWRLQPPHPRYLYFFSVHFGPIPRDALTRTPAAASASEPEATPSTAARTVVAPATPSAHTPRPASASVAWSRAIVRDAPRTGAVVAHLARGTALTVVSRQGSWWQVRWAGGEGWVFGEAIGQR